MNEDLSCQYCGISFEDTEHFFLSCQKYGIDRDVMLCTIYNFVAPISVEILLQGTNQYKLTVNKKKICDAVHIFIKRSKRL